jgi:LPXTG-site transpeptidase (sortase) family protein
MTATKPDLTKPVVPVVDEESPEQPLTARRSLSWLGVTLVLVGLVAVGYAVYRMVAPGIAVDRAQDQLTLDFDERLAIVEAGGTVETAPRDESPAVVSDPAEFDSADDVPVMFGMADGGSIGSAPQMEVPDGWHTEVPPPQGSPIGRIVIPAIDLDWMIVQGVSVPDLKQGPGHMPGTAMPGQMGNAVLSGHRTTYGAPFNKVDQLVHGDTIEVQTLIGTHTYEVVSQRIVHPREMWVTTQWDGAWLTLTSCHPKGSSQQRIITFAKLVDGPNAGAIAATTNVIYHPPEPPG